MTNVSGGPTYQELAAQDVEGPIFNDTHQDNRSCSIALVNDAGVNFEEVPAGTVISKTALGPHAPCGFDLAAAAVAAANVITLQEDGAGRTGQFNSGDWAFLAGATFPVKISSVDEKNKTITMEEAVTLDEGDEIVVDPSISVATADAAGAGVNTVTLLANAQHKKYRKGDLINIVGVTGARNVTAIDSATGVLTFDGAAASYAQGAKVVSQARGKYKITVITLQTNYYGGRAPGNVMAHYRTHGEAFLKRIKGMSPAIKSAFPLIDWLEINV